MERRQLLIAGAGTLATISGCLSSDGDPPQDGPDDGSQDRSDGEPSQAGTDTTPTEEPTEEGPDDDIGNYDPEDIAEQYFEALDDRDERRLTELSHSEGITIKNTAENADESTNDYEYTVKRSDLVQEDLAYFYQPSAIVELGYEQSRASNDASVITRDQVILVVEDGELRVFDTRPDDVEIGDWEVVDSCEIEDDDDASERLPVTNESFYHVRRKASFDTARGTYRGPDGNRLRVDIEVHDSEEDAEAVEPTVGSALSNVDGEWTAEAGLAAQKGNLTCTVSVESADATEQVDALYQEVGCFTEDDVVERSW